MPAETRISLAILARQKAPYEALEEKTDGKKNLCEQLHVHTLEGIARTATDLEVEVRAC